MDKLLSSKFTLGAEGSVAAGPVGRTATAQTDAQMHADILSWSRSQGLFAGVALEGASFGVASAAPPAAAECPPTDSPAALAALSCSIVGTAPARPRSDPRPPVIKWGEDAARSRRPSASTNARGQYV